MARCKISGQAEQYKHDWSLVNVTIDGTSQPAAKSEPIKQRVGRSGHKINHINNLDVLHSDIEWPSGHLAAFDASLENIQLPFELYTTESTFCCKPKGHC